MRVLVVGGLGSIGRRYCAILRYLGIEYEVLDIQKMRIDGSALLTDNIFDLNDCVFDKAIIATTTDTHFRYCKRLIEIGKPFLCEKPLSKNLEECKELVELDQQKLGFIVNNYRHCLPIPSKRISYNYFNTGSDEALWDACQLIYLDPNAEIMTSSPIWELSCNLGTEISYRSLENSYVEMIQNFILDRKIYLWTLEDGLKMTQAVLDRIQRENK